MSDPGLDAARTRGNLRRLVRDRGPDTGRDVDSLKARSADGAAAALLAGYEAGQILYEATTELTSRDGDGVLVAFMLDVSSVDGDDVLE